LIRSETPFMLIRSVLHRVLSRCALSRPTKIRGPINGPKSPRFPDSRPRTRVFDNATHPAVLFLSTKKGRLKFLYLIPRHADEVSSVSLRHILIKPKPGRCVTFLFPATYRHFPGLDGVGHGLAKTTSQKKGEKIRAAVHRWPERTQTKLKGEMIYG
jgi:hypothetical protein